MIVIGIDPGLTGAMAKIEHDGGFGGLLDLPVMERNGKGAFVKNQINGTALEHLLKDWLHDEDKNAVHIFLETPIAFPGQHSATVASAFLTCGIIEGVLQARHYPHTLVAPAQWKKAMGLTSSKEQCRARAIRIFPAAAKSLSRVRDHNRAESLLIAKYGHGLLA